MKTSIKIALFVVFFVAVGGILSALYLYNLKPKDLKNVKPDFTVSAVDLEKAFDANEKEASVKYINKIIEVSGEITTVKSGEKNSVNISLKTGNDLSSVICTFPSVKDTSLFKEGNTIVVRGVCSGFLMDVLLNNCAVIKNQ